MEDESLEIHHHWTPKLSSTLDTKVPVVCRLPIIPSRYRQKASGHQKANTWQGARIGFHSDPRRTAPASFSDIHIVLTSTNTCDCTKPKLSRNCVFIYIIIVVFLSSLYMQQIFFKSLLKCYLFHDALYVHYGLSELFSDSQKSQSTLDKYYSP